MVVFWALIPLVFMIAFNSVFVIITKQSFGRCIPLSMMSATLILYFSQLVFTSFKPGVIVVCTISAMAIPLWLFFKNKYNYTSLLLSVGLISFIVIYITYIIIDYHRTFVTFDEWYHWGISVKEMIRLDRFHSVEQATNYHKDYCPFIGIWQLLFCKLSGGYSEGRVSMALHIFTVSLICPRLTEKLCEGRDISKRYAICISVSILFIMLSVMLFFDPWWARITSTILIDILVSVIFAYAFLQVWFAEKDKTDIFAMTCLLVTNTSMVMIKKAGLGLSFIVMLGYLLKLTVEKKALFTKRKLTSLVVMVCSIVVPYAIYSTWTRYIKRLGIIGQFDSSGIDMRVYLKTLLGKEVGLRRDTLLNFFKALFSTKINQSSVVSITYVSACILIVLLLFWVKSKKGISLKEYMVLFTTFIIGALSYAFYMSLLYAFCFNATEMAQLSSYNRYMATYVLGVVLVIIVIGACSIDKLSLILTDWKKSLIVMFCFLVLNTENLIYIAPQAIRGDVHTKYEGYAAKLEQYADAGSKVFIIYNKANTDQDWYGPMQIYMSYYDNDLDIDYNNIDSFEVDMSNEDNKESVLREIYKNDYLFIIDVNENVKELLSDRADIIEENSVYKVYEDGTFGKLD